jgi:hypothetical protein
MADTGSDELRARCGREGCGHEWVVAYLPMDVTLVCRLAMGTGCAKCGHMKPTVAMDRKAGDPVSLQFKVGADA